MSIEIMYFFREPIRAPPRSANNALREAFELAKRQKAGVTTITEVAAVQAIPPRFLEVVLAELKRGGFVESRRGVRGG